jgi:general secretion pathway protein D
LRVLTAVLLSTFIFISSCSTRPIVLDHAEQLAQAGSYEEALTALQTQYKGNINDPIYKGVMLRIKNLSLASLNQEGESALRGGKTKDAESVFLRAISIDANNQRARNGLKAVAQQRQQLEWLDQAAQALERGNAHLAHELLRKILIENPRHEAALRIRSQLRAQKKSLSRTAQLEPGLTQNISLELRDAPLKDALMLISQSAGLNFILDKDLPVDTAVTLFVSEARVEDVLEFIFQTHALERKILNSKTLLIYPGTAEKKSRYAELYTRSFHVLHSAPNTIAELLRNVIKPTDLHIDETSRSLVIRDTLETLEAIERLIELHDVEPAEVLLDVEILEVSTDLLSNLGVEYPSKLTLSVQGQEKKPGILRWSELKDLNSDSFSLGVGDPLAVLNIKNTLGSGNILAKPQIRVKNREQANILIGDKVPVITSTLNQTSGFESQSVSYLDVGIKLDVQPEIFPDNEVSMKVMLEVSNIAKEIIGDNGLRAYQIGTRTASTTLQLRDGETQILAGLIKNEEINSEIRVPGLASIPGLGRLFVNENNTRKKSELVLLITPRIVRNVRIPDADASEFYSGTKDRFSLSAPQLGQSARYSQVEEIRPDLPLRPSRTSGVEEQVALPMASSLSMATPQLKLLAPNSIDSNRVFNSSIALDSSFKRALDFQLLYDNQLLEIVKILPALEKKDLEYHQGNGSILFKLQDNQKSRGGDILATVSFKARAISIPTPAVLSLEPLEKNATAATQLSRTQQQIMISPAEITLDERAGDISP